MFMYLFKKSQPGARTQTQIIFLFVFQSIFLYLFSSKLHKSLELQTSEQCVLNSGCLHFMKL